MSFQDYRAILSLGNDNEGITRSFKALSLRVLVHHLQRDPLSNGATEIRSSKNFCKHLKFILLSPNIYFIESSIIAEFTSKVSQRVSY